ncbi:hypothetical protein BAT02nite_00040 [Bacillus atrophaeus]|jgi:hypothetical protein|nr:hypothetical protein AXI57_15105 [Bacillus atrophaeus]GED00360.1 hypothetical protein BAT02nite_00040 [Bacillus atrophaeus]
MNEFSHFKLKIDVNNCTMDDYDQYRKSLRETSSCNKRGNKKRISICKLLGRKHNTKIKFAILGDISSQPIHCAKNYTNGLWRT